SSDEIQTLNRKHRDKDKPTDVLSFPQEEFAEPVPLIESPAAPRSRSSTLRDGPPKILGDVIICLDVAEENAREIGQSVDRELTFLIVHGVLHLCGYDHDSPADEAVMIQAQKQLMSWLETSAGVS